MFRKTLGLAFVALLAGAGLVACADKTQECHARGGTVHSVRVNRKNKSILVHYCTVKGHIVDRW